MLDYKQEKLFRLVYLKWMLFCMLTEHLGLFKLIFLNLRALKPCIFGHYVRQTPRFHWKELCVQEFLKTRENDLYFLLVPTLVVPANKASPRLLG